MSSCGIISYLTDINHDICFNIADKTFHFTKLSNTPTAVAGEHYIGFPFSFNIALSAVVFIYIGFFAKKLVNKVAETANRRAMVVLALAFMMAGCIAYFCNNEAHESYMHMVVMSYGLYGNYLLFICTAVALSLSTVFLAMVLDNPVMSKYGKYTLFIFAFHFSAMALPRIMAQVLLNKELLDSYPTIFSIYQAVVGLFILCLIIPYFQKLIPNLFGKKINEQ